MKLNLQEVNTTVKEPDPRAKFQNYEETTLDLLNYYPLETPGYMATQHLVLELLLNFWVLILYFPPLVQLPLEGT